MATPLFQLVLLAAVCTTPAVCTDLEVREEEFEHGHPSLLQVVHSMQPGAVTAKANGTAESPVAIIDSAGAPPGATQLFSSGSEKVIVLSHMANHVYYYPPDYCACSVAYPYCSSRSKYCYKSRTSRSYSSSVCPGTCSLSLPTEIPEAGYSLDECVEETSGRNYIPRMCFWVKQNPKQAVIAIKGTDSAKSTLADIKHIITGSKPMTAINAMDQKVHKYRSLGYFTLVTGHSLGGYLAELASSHFNVPGMGFQAPGPDADDWFFNVDPETGDKHTGDNGNSDFNILNAMPRFLTGDRLGNFRWPYFGHSRPPVWLRDLDDWSFYAHLGARRTEEIYKLRNYGSITNKNILHFTQRCPTDSYCRQSILPNAISCGKESYFLPGKPARRRRDSVAKRACRRD